MNARGSAPACALLSLPRLCFLLLAVLFPGVESFASDNPGAPLVVELKLDGEVAPVLATYIDCLLYTSDAADE